MKRYKKQKILSFLCMFLTAFSLFGETLLQTENAEASSRVYYYYWKQCTSIEELEDYLGKKYDPESRTESKWKDIKLVSRHNDGSWYYLDPSTMTFVDQGSGTGWRVDSQYGGYGSKLYDGGWQKFSDDDVKNLEKGYLTDSSGTGATVQMTETTYKEDEGTGSESATFQIKISDSISAAIDGCYKDYDQLYTLICSANNGYTNFAWIPSSRAVVASGPEGTDTLFNHYWWRCLNFEDGTMEILSYDDYYVPYGQSRCEESVPSASDGWCRCIYIPTCPVTVVRQLCPGGDIENMDWEKYAEYIKTTKGKSSNLYKTISGNYSLNIGETVTYTGDVTIPANATLTIPVGSTLIIGSNCTVFVDGLIQNNGTLIIESGALISYSERDTQNLDMVTTNITCLERDPEHYLNDRCIIYNKKGTSILGVGTDYLSAESGAKSVDSSGVAHVALFKNGIYNNGDLIVRKHAAVDIPRFTQSTTGHTWLYGTMVIEEIFQLGGNIAGTVQSTCLPDYNRPSSSMNFNQSNGILSADSNFTIDEGMLYLFYWKCSFLKWEDQHQKLWFQSVDNWNLTVNRYAYYNQNYPFMGTTDNECFDLIGQVSILEAYIKYYGIKGS